MSNVYCIKFNRGEMEGYQNRGDCNAKRYMPSTESRFMGKCVRYELMESWLSVVRLNVRCGLLWVLGSSSLW
jgi:hypothetical protein